VLDWFASLGCGPRELERARAFDTSGYVGIPFPTLSPDKIVRHAKYLALWLLWDDTHVESLENQWRLRAEHVHTGLRPPEMTRFDEGWWQLFEELAAARSARWLEEVCQEMATWSAAATEEAVAFQHYRETGIPPSFERQLELRTATIGMYATVYLLEDAYDLELPRAFHEHPTVRRLKVLSNEIVGLGNDLLGFGKDLVERHLNLVSTLMAERSLSVEDALSALVQRHDEALAEYDRLAASLESGFPRSNSLIQRWLQDVRYASLGFSRWEAQAPRYTAHKVVVQGRVIEPTFAFTSEAWNKALP
jgi:Terpene synthase family 2, C-terminal metal binding